MTPVYKINIKEANVWAKLENWNPTGTHKDRSIGPWIEHYVKQGIKEFAIASSGNSAISATRYCAKKRLGLHVFVAPDSAALSRLRRDRAALRITKTPRRDAIRFCCGKKIVNLRASTDNRALIGYEDIAFELRKQLPRIDSIFIPTSSGATIEGIHQGFKLPAYRSGRQVPSFFVVQTTKVHPIASYFDRDFKRESKSYATAIVDNIAHRRDKIIKICKETSGGGFVISNKELEEARETLRDTRGAPRIGWQSALGFAGFLKWRPKNVKASRGKTTVCLFTD